MISLISEVVRLSPAPMVGSVRGRAQAADLPVHRVGGRATENDSSIAPKTTRLLHTAIVLPGRLVLLVEGNLAE